MTWQPALGAMSTPWAAQVSPENAWPEYPRPQMTRPDWRNLNGVWDYCITPRLDSLDPFGKDKTSPAGQILVPYPLESALSGVKRALMADEYLWYRRSFIIPETWQGRRVLLHFGAVDWETCVSVNGQLIGSHVGGYLPFWFDVTGALHAGENELVLRVWDPGDIHWQQRGKQTLKPRTIWYTAVSGIWQTVWLEAVPQTFIERLQITPDLDEHAVRLRVFLGGGDALQAGVKARVIDDGQVVAEAAQPGPDRELVISLPDVKPWTPDTPHLYELEVQAGQDQVGSYFGMRKFSLENARLCLNHAPLFQLGPLDQGYWPDGLYTPPTDEAMRAEIAMLKGLGFNMLRKHVKVEPARYYTYCDRIGLIVWQDMPNGGAVANEIQFFLLNRLGITPGDHRYHRSGRKADASREDYLRELREMVDHLYNTTCIGMWVPFNEGWGQFDSKHIAGLLKTWDPTRTVDATSGWFDQGGGDCKSLHIYFKKLQLVKPEKRRSLVLSEFGGYSLKLEGHLWDPAVKFGYINFDTTEALTTAYLSLIQDELEPWVRAGLSAAVYTQTTDVENEVNGYVTYDRRVEKMDFMKVRDAHRRLLTA